MAACRLDETLYTSTDFRLPQVLIHKKKQENIFTKDSLSPINDSVTVCHKREF